MNQDTLPGGRLLHLLEASPDGLSEYELLLRLSRWEGRDERLPSDTLELFRSHFLLFHTSVSYTHLTLPTIYSV